MKIKEEIICEWFNAWHNQKWDNFSEVFALNVVYSECFGAKYFGISQVINWKQHWHQTTNLLEWKVINITSVNSQSIVEWYFKFSKNGEVKKYNGVSIILWNNENKICSIRDYSAMYHNYKEPSKKYI